MRFDSGLLLHSGDISKYPPIDEWRITVKLLESAGYTAVWAAEHHFFWDGWTNPAPTNPLMFGAFAAGQTKKLRLAQCGICLPDWHPLRVAEDVAMLDHMSEGRVDFGALRGVNNRVNGNFNPKADRRNQPVSKALFWESFEIIQAAWKGEPFKYEGEFYKIPMAGWRDEKTPRDKLDPRFYKPDGELTHLQVVPAPYQKPTPPRYVMADTLSSNVECAKRGVGTLSYAQSFEATKAACKAFRDTRASDPALQLVPERFAAMRPIYVAPTQAQAEAVMRPTINLLMEYGVRANVANARKQFLAQDEEMTREDETCDWFDFLVRHEHCHVGTPEYVTDRLKKFEKEIGLDHLVLFWAVPLVTFEEYVGSLKLFADKVMPKF